MLSGFMSGLALGNAVAARYGERLKNPVRAYAAAEIIIALTGVGLVYLLPALGSLLAPWFRYLLDDPWILNPLRLLVAFLLLLVPSTAMGVTLPLLTKTLMTYGDGFGVVLGKLYGWNTLGAVAGVVSGEMYLLGALGVRGTALAAGAVSVVAALLAGWLSTWPVHPTSPKAKIVTNEASSSRGLGRRRGPAQRGQETLCGGSEAAPIRDTVSRRFEAELRCRPARDRAVRPSAPGGVWLAAAFLPASACWHSRSYGFVCSCSSSWASRPRSP